MPSRSALSQTILRLAVVISVLFFASGSSLAVSPSFFIQNRSASESLIWGDKQPGRIDVLFNTQGEFGASYPIDVYVQVAMGEDIRSYFESNRTIRLVFAGSRQYSNGRTLPETGSVTISTETRAGQGTIIFEYPGEYSKCVIYVDGTIDEHVQLEPPPIRIEPHAARWGMEIEARTLGVALIASALGLLDLVDRKRKK